MKYDVILSIIFYICGCFYMIYSATVVATHAKSKILWLYVTLVSVLAIWAFSYSISNSVSTAEVSALWRSFSALGWGTFSSLLLHLILILTKIESRIKKRSMLIMLYLPAVINVVLFGPYGCLAEKHYQMVQTDLGWVNMPPMYAARIWLNSYYVVFSIISILLLVYWWRKIESHTPEKREARNFIVATVFFFSMAAVIDTLPDILGKKSFPPLGIVLLIVPIIMLFAVLRKSGLIKKHRKVFRLQEYSSDLTDDRSRLFKTVTVIFEIGAAVTFLIGYFGMKGDLRQELILAAFLLFMGVIIRSIPVMTKKHTVQNAIFLTISTLGILYLVIRNAEKGATTIWAIYVLFLILNVILDGTFHAYFFAAITIIIQLVFWVLYPEITVVINGSEYLTRIAIIVLSFIAVRYLAYEYALKIKGFQRLAREQETLEKISSSFISINSENVHETIDQMMETAVEILGFTHAYLIEIGMNSEEATILNIYKNGVEREPLFYHTGMQFKIAELPLFRYIVEQKTPIVCEDTANISYDEAGTQKDYFVSRGINSFYAIPIMVENETAGIFVVEYNEIIDDISLAESRLNFLKIIANIMGDARKKILYEERLYNFAYFDEATQLANKNMLKLRIEELINSGKRLDRIALFDIELENLRMINDTFGHGIGEQIMIKSARILENVLEGCCDISRTGEGEFVVVLRNARSKGQIEECAKRLLASFSDPVSTETGIEALFVTVHIGISVYPHDGKDADTLLRNADLARYEAESTKEKVVFYSERLENNIVENTYLTNRLFQSLENDEFFLEYQPQISCETNKPVGIEALLRWTCDGSNRVSPARFIPILEQTGLIYDVGLWVLEQALREHKRIIAKGFPPLRMAVNLSVVQLEGATFIRDVKKIIGESGVKPQYIELEITESLFSEDPEDVIMILHKLKELGVGIAIDDFGKGYSSLNRLKLVPFDRIKIDKDIIDYINVEVKIAPITEIIILLTKAFHAKVTAEGVETEEQAAFLKSIGCDEIQGYYYSKPLLPEALEEFLKGNE
ncbi:MAG: EAL domain-containing protein [Christensenellales bacterium]